MSENPPSPPRQGSSFHSYFLLLLLVGVAVVVFNMVKTFLVPVMLAAVFVGIFYPFYAWLMVRTGQRENLSALICCVLLLACLVAPVYFLANLVAREAGGLYQTVEDWLVPLIQQDSTQLKAEFQGYEKLLAGHPITVESIVAEGITASGQTVSSRRHTCGVRAW